MNHSDQAALLLLAAEDVTLDRAALVKWADERILEVDMPPYWLIELSAIPSHRPEDIRTLLRQAANPDLCDTVHRMITVIDAHLAGILALDGALMSLWKIWSGENNRYETPGFPDEFADALVEWDCLDDPSVVPPGLTLKWEQLISEFRAAHPNVVSYYLNELKTQGQQVGAYDGDKP